MLTNLVINNGILSPKYDIYNNIYTVTIKEDVKMLDICYDISENVSIEIVNNNNLDIEEKVVSLNIKDNDVNKIIYLNVIHENTQSTIGLQNYFKDLEIKKNKEISPYVAPLIGVSCFLIIVIVFSILFHKRRN